MCVSEICVKQIRVNQGLSVGTYVQYPFQAYVSSFFEISLGLVAAEGST